MGLPRARSSRAARRLCEQLRELPLPCCPATSSRHAVGRVNSLFPPYSPQCQWAALLLVFLVCGVVSASHLLPKPHSRLLKIALWAWQTLPALWGAMLMRLLLSDPRARPPEDDSLPLRSCPYGCVFAAKARTKHCRQCGKCVEGFDHHCLWLNTCVGAQNYSPWLFFVASLFAWALVGSGIGWIALLNSLSMRSRSLAVGQRPLALATALASTAVSFWLLALLLLHAWLFHKGMTTREWIKGAQPDTTAPEPQEEVMEEDTGTEGETEESDLDLSPRYQSRCERSMSLPSPSSAFWQEPGRGSPKGSPRRRRSHSFVEGAGMRQRLLADWRRYMTMSTVDVDHSPM